MSGQINFDACIIIDMWEPDPNCPGFLQDYKFMNHFCQVMAKGRLPKAQIKILTTRGDVVNPLLWSLTSSPAIMMKSPTINLLENCNIIKSKQDKICIVGQHFGACLFNSNSGILDFLISGYENVYTDINLVNPRPHAAPGYMKDSFLEKFKYNPLKLEGKLKFQQVDGSIYKVTIEEKNENTDSRK